MADPVPETAPDTAHAALIKALGDVDPDDGLILLIRPRGTERLKFRLSNMNKFEMLGVLAVANDQLLAEWGEYDDEEGESDV